MELGISIGKITKSGMMGNLVFQKGKFSIIKSIFRLCWMKSKVSLKNLPHFRIKRYLFKTSWNLLSKKYGLLFIKLSWSKKATRTRNLRIWKTDKHDAHKLAQIHPLTDQPEKYNNQKSTMKFVIFRASIKNWKRK